MLPHLQEPPSTHHYSDANVSAYPHKFYLFKINFSIILPLRLGLPSAFLLPQVLRRKFICNFFCLMSAKCPAHLISSCFNLFEVFVFKRDSKIVMVYCTVSTDTQYDIHGYKNIQIRIQTKHITTIYSGVHLTMRIKGK